MKRLLLLISLTLFVGSIYHVSFLSADEGWINLGLYGGQVYDIAIDPDDHDKMFAGAYYGDGLAVTTDGGSNWGPVLTGQEWGELDGEATFRNTAVWAVKIAPSKDKNPANNIVWAVHNHGVSKSSNGGTDWVYFSNGTIQDDCTGCPKDATPDQPGSEQFRYCQALAIDPSDPQTVYVGTGGPNSTDKKGAIYKTSDGGDTWTKIGMTVTAYDPDPDNDPIDYDARDLNNEFYSTVKAIAVHPTNSDIVWAIDFNDILGKYVSLLYISTDGGETWRRDKDTGIRAFLGESALVVKQDEPNVLFYGTFSAIVRIEYPKDDEGNVLWESTPVLTFPIGQGSHNVRALAFDPQNPNILYAALGLNSNFKLLKSLDGGLTFTQEYAHDQQLIALSPHPAKSNILFGGDRLLGVFKGVFNSGSYTWAPISKGLNAIKVNDIAIDPNDPGHVIAGTMAGVFEKQGNGDWSSTAKLPYTEAFSVAFDPSDQDGSSFYAGAESRLAKTSNNGTSWTLSNNLGYPHYINDIAIDTHYPNTLFVTTRYPGGVWKSTNGGKNLFKVLDGNGQFDFSTVAIDPTNSNIVYAGGGNYFGENVPGKIYKSTNAGGTWTPIFSGITALSLLIDPENPAVIYAGCGYSDGSGVPLYKSSNGGRNWIKSYEGIPGEPTRHAVWGSSQSQVFISGHTGSVVKSGKDDSNVLYYDGNSWGEMDMGVSRPIYDIWGSSGSDIHAVGESGTTVYFNGSNWENVKNKSSEDLHSVWGISGVSVYAVGNAGTILNYNGSTWASMESPITKDLFGVWGSDWDNIFAVGSHGTILRFNGTRWSIIWSGVTAQLQCVWGTSSNDIFAVGNSTVDNGNRHYTILHYDGSSWSRMNTPVVSANRNGKLRSVWGSASNDVWAVGDDGIILHYNGANWAKTVSGTPHRLYDIWGDGGNIVYAVGLFGTLLYNVGAGWKPVNTGLSEFAIWNPVTDLKFRQDASGHRNLYASTSRQGVYVSPNEAGQWYSLGTPTYDVYALATGSCNIGTAGAALGGEFGWIYGQVIIEDSDQIGIENARVLTDSGSWDKTDANGLYVIHDLQPGEYNLTVQAKGYRSEETPSMVGIAAGAATPVFFGLDPLDLIPFTSATGRQIEITTVQGKLTSLNVVDPEAIADTNNRPSNLIYGLVDMEISVANPGDSATVIISLPQPAPQNYRWYKYSTKDGWYDFSDSAEFNDDRDEITLSFVDGGAGDDDQLANSIIIDPSGLGYVTPVDGGGGDDGGGGGGGGGGCFITTPRKF